MLRHAGDGEWVTPHRVRLEEVRLGLLEAHLAARLELGTPAEVIGDLEALVHAHQEREGFAALLMVALYRDGRQADALATYQRTRTWLLDELGLDPGSDLQQLEQEVLVHDASLGVPQSTIRAPCADASRREPAGDVRRAHRAGHRPRGHRRAAHRLPARGGRRPGRSRQDRRGDRRRSLAQRFRADRRRRVAGQARDGRVRRRRGRHGGCRTERRWRGSTPRTAQERPGRADPRQLRARPRLGDGARCPIARRRARLADPLHQPSPTRRRW